MLPQADPALLLPGAGKTARDLAEMYDHRAVLEVLDDFKEQASKPASKQGQRGRVGPTRGMMGQCRVPARWVRQV